MKTHFSHSAFLCVVVIFTLVLDMQVEVLEPSQCCLKGYCSIITTQNPTTRHPFTECMSEKLHEIQIYWEVQLKPAGNPSLWTLLHKFTDFDNNCLTTSQHDREINTLTHPSSVNLLYHNPFSVDKGHLHRYKLWSCSRPSPVSVSPCLHASFFTSHILHNGP